MNKYFELLTKGTDIKIQSIKTCIYCGDEFAFFDLESALLDKYGFSETGQCSTCTFKMHNSLFNDKHLYIRKELDSGKNIISLLSNDYDGNVIEAKKYKDLLIDDLGLKFGKSIGKDIFSDFKKIYKNFPKPSRLIFPGLENAEYASHTGWSKNIYLSYCVFVDCENVFYSLKVMSGCTNVFSSFNIHESFNVYDSLTVGYSHDICFSKNIEDSSSLIFCSDMSNCNDCIFCCNRVNSKYMIFNKQYSRKDYLIAKQDILKRLKSYNEFKKLEKTYEDFLEKNYVESSINISNSEKVVGESMHYSKNTINTFYCSGIEDSVNISVIGNTKTEKNINIINSVGSGGNCENFVGICSVGRNTYNIFFSAYIVESNNIYYSIDIEGCEEIMFSVGLRSKKYCILNRPYKKEEYFKLKEKIISDLKNKGEWGDYLGFDTSLYPYNDTLAYDYYKVNKVIFPSGEEHIIDKNANGVVTVFSTDFISDAELDLGGEKKLEIKWRIRDKEIDIDKNNEIIHAKNLPEIDEVTNDILQKSIMCEETGRPFKIMSYELEYLKKKGFPLPRIHHELRVDKLFQKRPIGRIFLGKSDLSGKDILTVYKNKPKHKIYSPDEYNDYKYK